MCVHDRLRRAERDAVLVEEHLRALRLERAQDAEEARELARLLALIEAKADELRAVARVRTPVA